MGRDHHLRNLDLSIIGGRVQESIDEANRAHQLDPLSPMISHAQSVAYKADRQFDKAIELNKKVIADNPRFGAEHVGLAFSYWGEHKYPEAIQEFRTAAQLMGDKNAAEFAAALDAGFDSGGWPGALRKSIEVSLAQRKAKSGYGSSYQMAQLSADLGNKDHAFEWLNTAYQEHDYLLIALRTDYTNGFPALRSALRRTGPQNRFAAIVTIAVLFPHNFAFALVKLRMGPNCFWEVYR